MAILKEVLKGFDFLDNFPRYRRVEANALMMSDAVHAENRPITLEVIRELFNRIKHQFAVNPEYAAAYETFFQKHPEYRLDANMAVLDSTLVHSGESVTVENLEDLLLPGNPHNVLDQLAITAAAREAKAEDQRQKAAAAHQAKETERMISEITGYMLSDGKIKREYTERQYRDKIAGLRAMPFSELVARYEAVIAARAQRKAPVEELRAVVKTDAARQRQALYGRYETIPDLYFPPGKSEGLRWSFDLFRRLPSMEQRRLLDHFGNDQLTTACAAKGN